MTANDAIVATDTGWIKGNVDRRERYVMCEKMPNRQRLIGRPSIVRIRYMVDIA